MPRGTAAAVVARLPEPGAGPLGGRLLKVLARPWLLWSVTAVFAVRDAVLWIFGGDRPDARNVVAAGRLYLTSPSHLYDQTIHALRTTGTIPVPGKGLLYPPIAAAMGAVPGVLAPAQAVLLWTALDAAALAAGLVLLRRAIGGTGTTRALFWLVVAYFPPLIAEVGAGQIGGFVLLASVGAALLTRRNHWAAGALAGLAASIKIYPAAMVLGAGPKRLGGFLAGLVASGVLLTLAFFIPLGLPWGPATYLTGVLLPATGGQFQDCAIDSVSTMFGRAVGGERYAVVSPAGQLQWITLPVHLPLLAHVLTAVVVAVAVAGTVWASWRSGWHPLYGTLLAFGLGAIVPSEVNPYQFLPLLPVTLLVAGRALAQGRAVVLLALAAGLLLFIRQPCALPFPNIWTVGGLLLFGVCAWQNELFRPQSAGGV